jgi:hypothetical protein
MSIDMVQLVDDFHFCCVRFIAEHLVRESERGEAWPIAEGRNFQSDKPHAKQCPECGRTIYRLMLVPQSGDSPYLHNRGFYELL